MTLKSTITLVPTFRKFFLSDAPALWANLRGLARVYRHYLATSFFRFVGKHISEDRPRSIIHRLGKHSTRQPFDIQLLNSNQGVAINQTFRQLMQEVSTLVTNLAMARSHTLSVLFPLGMGANSFSKLPLLLGKPLLPFAVVARVLNLLASRQVGKVFKPNIYPNGWSGMLRNVNLTFNREAHEPLVAFSLYGNGLDLPTNRAVQLDFERTNLRESEAIFVEGPTQLRVGETIVSVVGSEPRKARFITTLHSGVERLIRPVYLVQHILQGLAIDRGKVWSNLFALYQGGGLLGEADTLTSHTVRIPTVLQGSVVQLSAQVKVMLQEPCLPAGRAESVLVGASGEHKNNSLSRGVNCRGTRLSDFGSMNLHQPYSSST